MVSCRTCTEYPKTYKSRHIQKYEEALMKELQVEMDDRYPAHPIDNRIEEQLEIMQKSLRELNLKGQDIWCTNCSIVGHTKDNC